MICRSFGIGFLIFGARKSMDIMGGLLLILGSVFCTLWWPEVVQEIAGYQCCSAVRFEIGFFRFGARKSMDIRGDLFLIVAQWYWLSGGGPVVAISWTTAGRQRAQTPTLESTRDHPWYPSIYGHQDQEINQT